MRRNIRIIYLKELSDILRDRRTIFMMIIIPLILYPVLIIFTSQITISQVDKLRKKTFKMAIPDARRAPELITKLKDDKSVEIVNVEGDIKKAILDKKIQIAIAIPEDFQGKIDSGKTAKVEMIADLSDEKTEFAKEKVERIIREFREDLTRERLKGKGLEAELIKPVETSIINLASPKKMGGRVLGPLLFYMLIIFLLMSAMYPAIDLTAGEKERGTIETLLVAPVSRMEMVIGKYLTVFTISLTSGLMNISSMALSFSRALPMREKALTKINLTPSIESIIIMLPFMVVLAGFFSAVAISISTYAKSFREAQSYATPLMFIVILPAMISFVPGLDLTLSLALVPIVNVALLSKKIMLGDYPLLEIFMTFTSMAFFAYLALRFAINVFQKEEVLLRTSEETQFNWRSFFLKKTKILRQHPSPEQIFFLFLMQISLFYYIATPLQTKDIRSGILISEFALILGSTLIFSRILGLPLSKTFNLKPAKPLAFILAVAIGASTWFMAYSIFWLEAKLVSIPESYIKLWEGISLDFDKNLLYGTIVVALSPAICEEAMFRGFTLNGLVPRYGKWSGILISGALFGIFHMDYRILPTAFVGIIFGYLVLKTGSIYPAMMAHGIHNFSALLAQRIFTSSQHFKSSDPAPPIWLLAICLTLLLSSLYFLSKKFALDDGN